MKYAVPMLAAALSVAMLAPARGGAQVPTTPSVSIGTRVRVFAPEIREDRFVGRVDSLDAMAMVLDTAGVRSRLGFDTGPVLVDEYRRVSIRLASIQRIEVSGGRSNRRSTVRGIIVGGLAGGLLWGLGNLPERNPGAHDFVVAFPVGAAIGAVAGGTLGYLLGSERWLPARVPR